MVLQIIDENVRKRSLMLQKPRLCNGEANGQECTHYFQCTVPLEVQNADHLHRGETTRMCLLIKITGKDGSGGPMDLGDGGCEMPTACNRYEPSARRYTPTEAYEPLTPEQIEALANDEASDEALANDEASDNISDTAQDEE